MPKPKNRKTKKNNFKKSGGFSLALCKLMMSKVKKAAFAFIDVENIRGAAHDAGYKDFNFQSICDWLKQKHDVKRIYLFTAIDDGDNNKKNIFEELRKRSECIIYSKEVITYRTNNVQSAIKCPKCSHTFVNEIKIPSRRKGNCDTELTLELMRQGIRGRYSHAIIFSGDGDFASVYEHLTKELKKKVIIVAPLGKLLGHRTSLKIKKMSENGQITLLALNDLFDKHCIK